MLDNIDAHYSKLYYVIFKESLTNDWRVRWLDPFFRHVVLARKSDSGQLWIITDFKGGNIHTSLEPMADIREYFPNSVILKFKSKIHKKFTYRIWNINCVEIAKIVLGIRKLSIITPYQLYKYILNQQGDK